MARRGSFRIDGMVHERRKPRRLRKKVRPARSGWVLRRRPVRGWRQKPPSRGDRVHGHPARGQARPVQSARSGPGAARLIGIDCRGRRHRAGRLVRSLQSGWRGRQKCCCQPAPEAGIVKGGRQRQRGPIRRRWRRGGSPASCASRAACVKKGRRQATDRPGGPWRRRHDIAAPRQGQAGGQGEGERRWRGPISAAPPDSTMRPPPPLPRRD